MNSRNLINLDLRFDLQACFTPLVFSRMAFSQDPRIFPLPLKKPLPLSNASEGIPECPHGFLPCRWLCTSPGKFTSRKTLPPVRLARFYASPTRLPPPIKSAWALSILRPRCRSTSKGFPSDPFDSQLFFFTLEFPPFSLRNPLRF